MACPAGVAQIDLARKLAASRVDHQRFDRRQMRRGHQQHVRAVRRERAAADRARDDAREIEDPHAAERAWRLRKRLRRRIADALDRECRQRGHRHALRVAVPFLEGSLRRDHESRLGRSLFEVLCAPLGERLLHGSLVVVAGEERQHAVAMMREIGVQANPPAVAAAVGPGDLVPKFRQTAFPRHENSARCGTRRLRGACRP